MKRMFLFLIVLLLLPVLCMPAYCENSSNDGEAVVISGTHQCNSQSFETQITSLSSTLSGGTYYLGSDVTKTDSVITISGHVSLCLNGHTLTVKQLSLSNGATFDLYDCSQQQSGMIYSTAASHLINISTAATMYMHSGIIKLQTSGSYDAILVNKDGASMTMDGGSVIAATTTRSAVHVNAGLFTMNGGVLSGGGGGSSNQGKAALGVTNLGSAVLNGGVIKKGNGNTIQSGTNNAGYSLKSVDTFLKDNLSYYVDSSSESKASVVTGSDKSYISSQAVYISAHYSVTLRINDFTSSKEQRRSGSSLILPTTLTDEDGNTIRIASYTLDKSTSYPAGESIAVNADMTLTANPVVICSVKMKLDGQEICSYEVDQGNTFELPATLTDSEGTIYRVATYTQDAENAYAPGSVIQINADLVLTFTQIPTINISMTVDGQLFCKVSADQDSSYTLPATLTDSNGVTYHVTSYDLNGTTYAPGDSMDVGQSNIELAVTLNAHKCDGQYFAAQITSLTSNTLSNGTYYLGSDVTYSSSNLTVSGDVKLCLNGYTLNLADKYIDLDQGASLTICDCQGNTGMVTSTGSKIINIGKDNTAFTFKSGKLTGSNASAVYVPNADPICTVSIEGGLIQAKNCVIAEYKSTDRGGAKSKITITGGELTATNCAVAVKDSDFELEISGNASLTLNNTAGSQCIYLSRTTATIGGNAKVTGNSTTKQLIQCDNSANLTIKENAKIESAQIGKVAVYMNSSSKLNVSGGQITNTGVTVQGANSAAVSISGGTITSSECTIKMSGAGTELSISGGSIYQTTIQKNAIYISDSTISISDAYIESAGTVLRFEGTKTRIVGPMKNSTFKSTANYATMTIATKPIDPLILNNCKLLSNSAAVITIIPAASGTDLSIENGSELTSSSSYGIQVRANTTANLQIQDSTIIARNQAIFFGDSTGGSITISGKDTILESTANAWIDLQGSTALTISDGSFAGTTRALYVRTSGTVSLSGGTYTATGANGKPIVIDSTIGATLGDLLASGYGYYEDSDADTSVTQYSADEKEILYPATVYVRQIPEVCTLSFADEQGNIMSEKQIRKGKSLVLSVYQNDQNGLLRTVTRYIDGSDVLNPGATLVIDQSKTLTVSFLPVHECKYGSFGAYINSAIASAYTDVDFTMSTGEYFLADDIVLHGNINVNGNVKLCLNGHSVKVNQIKLVSGATLTFCDCSANHDGTFQSTETEAANPAIDATASNTRLRVLSGRIIADGMGISVSGGSTFEMSGGRLVVNGEQECCMKIAGGSSVTLANCTIEGQAARLVNLGNGTLTINAGAELIGNSRSVITTSTTTESPYIPVHLNDANAVLIINGGEISSTLDDAIYAKKYKEIQIRGGRIVGGYDGYSDGRSALYIANGSGGTCTVSGGTITNQSYHSKGPARGIGITNYGKLIITGSAVVEGSRYALWNKSQATVTTDVSVQSPDRLVGGETAVLHTKGILNIAGGVLIGSRYALQVDDAMNGADGSVGTVILSGGRYTCSLASGSPVYGQQDVDDYLKPDSGLGYYLYAEGPQNFADDTWTGYLSDKHKLNPAVCMTAYVRTYDDKPCPHDEWAWQNSEGQPDTLGVCTACGTILVKYAGCSMTIDKDLSMTFKLQLYDETNRLVDSNWSMQLSRDSSTGIGITDTTAYDVTVYANETSRTGDTLTFTYHGINSQCMTTPIHAKLNYTEEAWRKVADPVSGRPAVNDKLLPLPDRTVREYCVKLYAQGTSDKTVTLIANLLKYGAASQVYNNWYTDQPATGGDASVLISRAKTAPAPSAGTSVTKIIDGYVVGVTLRMGYQTQLVYVVGSIPGQATLKILCGETELKSVSVSAGDYVYYAVTPMNYDVLFTAQLYTADGALAYQRTYSVDAYVQRYWNSTTAAGNMLREMYHFSRASMDFINKTANEFVARASAAEGVLSLPDSLEQISESAFESDSSLSTVIIGGKVQRIESRAFAGSSVKLVVFPENCSLRSIAPDAFAGTSDVQFIVGGSSVAREYLGTDGITEYNESTNHGDLVNVAIRLPYIPY